MANTSNHSFNTPDKGEQNWHLDLNENFDSLDQEVEIRDQEANKADYDPQDGAKYIATDSGAVYHGNGSSWVLADRKVGALKAENINDALLTPQSNTIQAIQDLLDNYRNPCIRLKPGTVYEGNTQLTIDSFPSGNYERSIKIDANGAGINYTGNGKVCCQIQSNTEAADSGGNVGDAKTAADAFGGSVALVGGSWYGPGRDVADSCAIRQDDSFGNKILPAEVRSAENGLLFRNKYLWNESNQIGIKNQGAYRGDVSSSRVINTIRLAGGNSEYPTSDGSASFKNSHIHAPFISAADDQGGAALWYDGAMNWGGETIIGGFIPDGGSFLRWDFQGGIGKFVWVYLECEKGDADSIGVEMNSGSHPLFINPRIDTAGTEFGGTNPGFGYLTSRGWRNNSFSITLDRDNGFKNTWLRMSDPENSPKYEINNQKDAFTLETNVDTYINGRGPNGKAPFRGQEFQAEPNNGASRRSFKGSFDEHPSAENGDTWYITGNGSPVEGFYGQKSNGHVQIG